MSRVMKFSQQRVLFTFLIFGLAFAFTTAVLWGHIESVIGKDKYQTMAKAGLLLLPAVALIMTSWELFVDKVGAGRVHALHPKVKHLMSFCFWGSILLLLFEITHAGALLKYESSTAEQKATIAAIGDAQAKIAGASASAATESTNKMIERINKNTSTVKLRAITNESRKTIRLVNEDASAEVNKAAAAVRPNTFLPDWYIDGGMYAAFPLLAALLFGITMALARQAAPFVDANDDGIPDAQQQVQASWPEHGFRYFDAAGNRISEEQYNRLRVPSMRESVPVYDDKDPLAIRRDQEQNDPKH